MRVLVTAGGTEEPVDGVRRLTNTSTGATGSAIARYFHGQGAEVLLLHSERATVVAGEIECDTFVTFADLQTALRRHLSKSDWDAVIHLAAVSDYSVASLEVDGHEVPHGDHGKIGSGVEVVIRLEPNPKLIDSLRDWSRNPKIRVVGFKLTNEPDPVLREERVRALLGRGTTDLVVHNDLSEITSDRHAAQIWNPLGPLARTETKEELADVLFDLVLDDTCRSRPEMQP
jgi:phosphopantothenoylcysteine decarboxylase/phosphopantothenate--cysteine ligase